MNISIGPAVSGSLNSRHAQGEWDGDDMIVMQKYKMNMSNKAILQQSKLVTVRPGKAIHGGTPVLVKVYNCGRSSGMREDLVLRSFRTQISLLQKLQEPFGQDSEPCLIGTDPSE